MWSTNFNELSITMKGDEKKIRKIPFKVISDYTISKHPDAKSVRRCGVKFGKLTSRQKSNLDSFIEDHTVSSYVMDRRSGQERRQEDGSQYSGPEMRSGIERRKNK